MFFFSFKATLKLAELMLCTFLFFYLEGVDTRVLHKHTCVLHDIFRRKNSQLYERVGEKGIDGTSLKARKKKNKTMYI